MVILWLCRPLSAMLGLPVGGTAMGLVGNPMRMVLEIGCGNHLTRYMGPGLG